MFEVFGFSLLSLLIFGLAVIFVLMGIKTVPQGSEFTLERSGRYARTLKPDLHVIVPIIDQIGRRLNMMEQVLDVPTQEVITKDNPMVSVDGVVFYQVLEVEGSRQAAILKAEGEKQAAILQAEGRREAAYRDAEVRERGAQAEAEATRMVSDAISRGNIRAIDYFVAQRYTAALQYIAAAPNQKLIMMPLEASSLIGAIGGIAAIARETFGPGTGGPGAGGVGTDGGVIPSGAPLPPLASSPRPRSGSVPTTQE